MNDIITGAWDDIANLPMLLKHSSIKHSSRPAMTSVDGTSYNYQELERASRYLAVMLRSFGIGKDDRVAILGENSPHWAISYFGTLTTGATTVPILSDFQGPEIISILEHAGARCLFISGRQLRKVKTGLPSSVELVIQLENFRVLDVVSGSITAPATKPGKLEKLQGTGKLEKPQDTVALPRVKPGDVPLYNAEPDDIAAIIYTSGTTGRSKGVMLTHHNIVSNAKASGSIHQVMPGDRFLSILPLAHTYECTIGMVVPLLNGASVHYIDRAPTASYLAPLLQQLKPTTMLTVPLVIEKIYRARVKPALTKTPLLRFLMLIGPTRKLLSRAAVRKLMKFFGGELRFFGVGGAPLAPDVEQFLLDGGFPYAIGYGLTETSPMIAGFGPANAVYRSVGRVMKDITVKIENPDPVTGEGEILVQGPNVMKGYYKEREKSAEVLTGDGFFRTGDLGYMNRKGILFIRGRLKNMILGANGENIYPEEIEAVINSREIVNESLVMQYKGKLVARVHLKMEVLEERLQHLKENSADFQQQLQERASEVLEELMLQVNQHVSRNARLQMMILQLSPFEKTPTQKIKRFLYM